MNYNEIPLGDPQDSQLSESAKAHLQKVITAMNRFEIAYNNLSAAFDDCYRFDNLDENDFIVEKYPFDQSFNELPISAWIESAKQKISEVL